MYNNIDDYFAPPPSKEIVMSPGASQGLSDDELKEILAAIPPDADVVIKSTEDEISAGIPIDKDEYIVAGSYRFPDMSQLAAWLETHRDKTSKELLITIGQLSHERRDAAGNRSSYFEARDELCAISILLNERGDYAPRARGMRVPVAPRKSTTKNPVAEHALSNDRQVIDLHWLYCRQLPVIDSPGYEGMLNSGLPFDWHRASNFVNRVGTMEKKANLLGLTEYAQLQLAAIQSKSVSDRWVTIREGLRKQQEVILTSASAPSSRLSAEVIRRLPNIYRALRVARGSLRRTPATHRPWRGV
jgi:hypothetical protein